MARRLAALLLTFPFLAAAQSAVVTTDHVRAELLAHAPEGLAPGKPVWLGLLMTHQPHWHTYWRNPGDSGLPTTLTWQLPAGVEAGEIEWPTPKQLRIGPLMNYGYEGKLLLPVPVKLPVGFSSSGLDVKLRADWLVCKETCIPESADFSLRVPAPAASVSYAALFASARLLSPVAVPAAVAKTGVFGNALTVEVAGLPVAAHGRELKLFAETAGVIDHAAAIGQRWDGDRWIATAALSSQRSESPSSMHVVLVGADPPALRIRLDTAGQWPGAAQAVPGASRSPDAPQGATPFLLALGLALLGGVLLNLMPCVFPVLSLKVVRFADPAQDRRSLAAGGLAYTVGVVLSFVVLAGLLLILRAGGEQVGWGFQLQSPGFVAALAVLFTLIGLNLAGLFEIGNVLPSGLAALRARHPLADHALTGALAVAVASPCTGPFMGLALGSALVLPAAQALSLFAVLGLGMALPYLAVSVMPGLASRLPRPGVWMARFKALMAFPMLATVVWLVWVLGRQLGVDAAAGLLALLLAVAFAAWALGTPGFGTRARWGFGALAAALLATTLAWNWLAFQGAGTTLPRVDSTANGRWKPWSADVVARARNEGRPVFVDFTAAWCVTCQFNKHTTLSNKDVLADLDARNVLLLRADWTRRDPAITQELARLGRSGVPVYVFYPPGNGAPVLLPEILRAGPFRQSLANLHPGA